MNLTSLYRWYEQNRRVLPWRDTRDPYCIWISEIILQQTRVAQGLDYYMRFVRRFPDLHSLAQAEEDEVLVYWQGLGYYSRARNLHRAARLLWEGTGEMPTTYDGLRRMPGVGEYTAGAIASFAYNMPYPALDGNVYRVLARLFDCDTVFDTSSGKRYFHGLAEQILDKDNPRLFNSAVMELGALQCLPGQPDCEVCPLKTQCLAYIAGTVALLPVRKPRITLKDRYLTYTIYIAEGHTLIYQRQGKDIWQHLWEFVLEESENHVLALPKGTPYVDINHVLSHQRLHARFAICRTDRLPQIEGTRCVRLSELDAYGLSRLTLKALDQLRATAGF